jgi:hypothetical protein
MNVRVATTNDNVDRSPANTVSKFETGRRGAAVQSFVRVVLRFVQAIALNYIILLDCPHCTVSLKFAPQVFQPIQTVRNKRSILRQSVS